MRAWALAASRSRPVDSTAHDAFIKRKALMAYTRPGVDKAERRLAAERIAARAGASLQSVLDQPTPGGVGFGVMFDPIFLDAWKRGTSVVFTVICPHRPGGNVDTWLYLTSANRASLGVEAFISYFSRDSDGVDELKVLRRRNGWRLAHTLRLHLVGVDAVHPAAVSKPHRSHLWLHLRQELGRIAPRQELPTEPGRQLSGNLIAAGWDNVFAQKQSAIEELL